VRAVRKVAKQRFALDCAAAAARQIDFHHLPLMVWTGEPVTSDSSPVGRTQKPSVKSPPLATRSAVKSAT
jgi:hypothetical protein